MSLKENERAMEDSPSQPQGAGTPGSPHAPAAPTDDVAAYADHSAASHHGYDEGMTDKTPTPSLSNSLSIHPPSEESIIRRVRAFEGGPEGDEMMDEAHHHHHNRYTGVGSILDKKYKILHKIATGGMGVVFSAVHVKLGKQFAVKVISPGTLTNEEAHRRFVREAKASTMLSSPHTVRVFDYNITLWGEPYLVMEYISGQNLRDTIQKGGAFPPERGIHVIKQITQSLMEAHENGLVHRDLKPSNVMLTQVKGHRDFVKIFDFGVVKFVQNPDDVDLTRQGAMLGTPRYMAPEQIATPEEVTFAADVYSLGLLLYYVLTGEKPFEDVPSNALVVQKLDKKTSIKLPKHLDIPKSLHTMFAKMTANDPAKRPSTEDVFFFLSDLETELKVGTWSGSKAIILPQQQSFAHRFGPWLLMTVFLLIGALIWALWLKDNKQHPPDQTLAQTNGQAGLAGRAKPPQPPQPRRAVAPIAPRPAPRQPDATGQPAARPAARKAAPRPAKRPVTRRPKRRRPAYRRWRRRVARTPKRSWRRRLTIRTMPSNAKVYLNGKYLGKSPVSFRQSRRQARVTVRKSGHFSKKILIPSKSTQTTFTVRLKEIRIELP